MRFFRWGIPAGVLNGLVSDRRKRLDKLGGTIAWHMPHWLVSWCGIRLWANATMGPYGNTHPDTVSMTRAIDLWYRRMGGDPTFADSPSKQLLSWMDAGLKADIDATTDDVEEALAGEPVSARVLAASEGQCVHCGTLIVHCYVELPGGPGWWNQYHECVAPEIPTLYNGERETEP